MSWYNKFSPGSITCIEVLEEDDDRIDYVDFIDPGYGYPVGTTLYALPHQCDSWVIGTRWDVMRLINELRETLRKNGDL